MYRAAMISQLIALSIKGKFTDVFVCQVSFSYNLSQVTGFLFSHKRLWQRNQVKKKLKVSIKL